MKPKPLSESERDCLIGVLGTNVENGPFSFMPRVGETNWGYFPLITIQHRHSGKAATYYRWPVGHPRSWIKRFSGETTAGAFS